MFPGEMIQDGFQIFVIKRFARLDCRVCVEDFFGARLCPETIWPFASKQAGDEFRTIFGEFEQGFVHQVQVEIPAPDIDDEHHLWLDRYDVGEILLRAHAEIDAARLDRARQIR